MKRRLLTALVGVPALVVMSGIGLATPSVANTIDTFTLSPSSAAPGATVTATATFTATSTPGPFSVGMALPVGLRPTTTWTPGSGSVSPVHPGQNCVIDDAAGRIDCQWRPTAVGEQATLTATFTMSGSTAPGSYVLVSAGTGSFTNGPLPTTLTVLSDATPAVSVSPATVEAGATSTATGTFTANTTGDITVGVFLQGTSGNGTFGSPVSAPGLTGCTLDSALRGYTCTWTGATIGDTRTIIIPVLVAAGTPGGSNFTVQSCTNRNTATAHCANSTLAIVTTAPPTPTATPTGTTDPGNTAVPTAVPAGEGPLDPPSGGSSAPWLAVIAAVGIAVAGSVFLARRGRRHG